MTVEPSVCEELSPAQLAAPCAICLSPLGEVDVPCACPGCHSRVHQECWQEIDGCATYGCEFMPTTVKALEPPGVQTHWGQAEKTCPSCGEEIKAAALRCKHCGEEFASQAPQSRGEYESARVDKVSSDRARSFAIAAFVCGVIPITAPFSLVLVGGYVLLQRRIVRGLPATQRVLYGLGLLIAALNTVLVAAVVFTHGT